MAETKADQELQAFIEEAKKLRKEMPAEAAPAEATAPIGSLEEMARSGQPMGGNEAAGLGFSNSIALGQLDKVAPYVGRFVDWANQFSPRELPKAARSEADVGADIDRARDTAPGAYGAGRVAGDALKALTIGRLTGLPFAGGILAPNTAERAIDVERGKTTPGKAVAGTAFDATAGLAARGAGELLSKIPPSAALRALPPGTTGPGANAALQPVAQAEKASVGQPIADTIARMATPAAGGVLHSMGVPFAGPASLAYGAVQGVRSIPDLFRAASNLASNVNIDSARRAIDLLTTNPTKATLDLIGAGPSGLQELLKTLTPLAVTEAGPGRSKKEKRF